MTVKKSISRHAQVAKIMKQFCNKLGVKCSSRSSTYSMGDSVRVSYKDQPPEVHKKIEAFASDYQQGHFNGMEDIYEYSPNPKNLPRTKYLFCENSFSHELKQFAWEWLRDEIKIDEMQELPKLYKDVDTYINGGVWGRQPQQLVFQALNGSLMQELDKDAPFWLWYEKNHAPKVEAPSIKKGVVSEAAISQHTHTKRGFKFFIVEIENRVSKEDFKLLLAEAKTMGGWYSRKWGETPAGFGFKDHENAVKFFKSLSGSTAPEPTPDGTPQPPAKPTDNAPLAAKLRKLSEGMTAAIDAKLADRPTHTARMLKQAKHARIEGLRMVRTQTLLSKMADCLEAGKLPPALAGITSKKAAHELTGVKLEAVGNGYHGYHIETDQPATDTPATAAAFALIDSKPDIEAQRLQNDIDQLIHADIEGYYPTPELIAREMVMNAGIEAGHKVLEPSAGSGAIAKEILSRCPDCRLDVIEQNYSLSSILERQGYNTTQGDFMSLDINTKYDKIIMNPPFERQQDIDHITKAFSLLNDGGTLIAICSESIFFRQDKKTLKFHKDILDGHLYRDTALHDKDFKESGTNVNTRWMIIHK